MLNRTPPAWLKDVQTLTSPELDQLEADLQAGKLTEEAAKPLLLEAGLRAAGKRLARERLVAQGGQAARMEPVPRR